MSLEQRDREEVGGERLEGRWGTDIIEDLCDIADGNHRWNLYVVNHRW